ncbi:golgi matrix protein [Microdochium bolleyi]|uniref:Golgi matrix protein n=1 Tax=Microdochium bolleyi TaxID=196109 RepID=A0A136JIE6_9PEZI|nr:golgi matrix protein [Microdochium bolleyi]
MSPQDPAQQNNAASTKKKNNKKKKNAAAKAKAAEDPNAQDAASNGGERDDDEADHSDGAAIAVSAPTEQSENGPPHPQLVTTNGHPRSRVEETPVELPQTTTAADATGEADTNARLEAMSQEREALRAEVGQLRKQLEDIQENHTQETTQLKTDLEESEAAKEQAQEQYEDLLERVEKIKETVGTRLARGKEELEEANQRIEELEAQNEELQSGSKSHSERVEKLETELQDANRELASLRSRNNLSQHNSLKEKEDLTRQIQHLREEAEAAKDAMGDWEVLAMEERSVRENLAEKASALEEQIASLKDNYERAASERDSQSNAVDSLQRALREIQDARKKELREMVESSEEQLGALKKLVQEADTRASAAQAARESLQKELERTAPFEKEVKEKNLLIGKLRHEAIVLNDHLTKALRYLKKTKPEDSIDRQLVTNHFLQFLSLDRSDPRKFQILQIIAGMLNWTDEQREQAGLARPGASSNSLRLPSSPFHRTPSTPSLNSEFFADQTPTSATKESLADLWAGFLERSVEEGSQGGQSRKGSMSSVATGQTGTTTTRPDTKSGH